MTFTLYQDLQSDKISLPQVAQRIQQVFQNDQADAGKLVEILISDPAISGKLIKVANSPVYQGLVHDLGFIVIIDYLDRHSEEISDPQMIEQAIMALRSQITGQLLQKWNFTDDMITVAEECEDRFRNNSENPDLCDLVIVAQYHAQIGTEGMHNMPPISKIPAITKLNMTPQQSFELLKESSREISDIESMLG